MIEYPEYRASLRAVSQLSGADGGVSKPSLTVGELEGALSPEVSLINHPVQVSRLLTVSERSLMEDRPRIIEIRIQHRARECDGRKAGCYHDQSGPWLWKDSCSCLVSYYNHHHHSRYLRQR